MSKILIFLAFSVYFAGISITQVKPVILSSRVGEDINSAEREKFVIIGGYKDFKSAVFYRSSDGKYSMKVKYLDSEKRSRDTIVGLEQNNIFNLALRIEFFEDISEGIYPVNPEFSLDSAEGKYYVRIKNVNRDLLPFVNPKKEQKIFDPQVGFGLNYSYFKVDLSSVKSFFDAAENRFRQEGWPIPNNNLNFDVSQMYALNFYIRVYRTFGIDFETGRSTNSDVDFWYSAGYLCYNLDLKNSPVKPFAAVGIGKYSYYAENIYNATVDSNGTYLEKISSGGGSVGYFLKTGFEIGAPTGGRYLPVCLNVFALYSFFPDIKSSVYGYETTVKLGGYRLGAGLRFYI